jgi:REP element-mobilizing transposase RayT
VERLALKALIATVVVEVTQMTGYPQRLHHDTPGWVRDGALFHVRLRVHAEYKQTLMECDLAQKLLAAAKRYHDSGRWWCDLILLMPDHVHALLAFPVQPGMSTVMRNWKRGAARMQGVRWQGNYFDHRIRTTAEGQEKWWYIRRNPVVKGLCASEEDWPHWWSGSWGSEMPAKQAR